MEGQLSNRRAVKRSRKGKAELGMLILLSRPRCHIPKHSPSLARGCWLRGCPCPPPLLFPSCKTQRILLGQGRGCSGKAPNQVGFWGPGTSASPCCIPKWPRCRGSGGDTVLVTTLGSGCPFPSPPSFSIRLQPPYWEHWLGSCCSLHSQTRTRGAQFG